MSLRTRVEALSATRPLWALGGVVALLVSIALLDYFTGLFHLTMLYVVPIVIATYIFGIAAGLATASVALIEIGFVHSHSPTPVIDFATDFVLFLFVAIVIEGMRIQLATIRALQERRDQDFEIARKVQNSIISPAPFDERFETACVLEFASEVGGDYYRFDRLGDVMLVFVADISGKSVAAALFAVLLDQAIEDGLADYESLVPLAESLNRRMFAGMPPDMFVTMVIAAIDDRRLTYVNCGHVRPLFFEADSGETFELAEGGSMPLGVADVLDAESATRSFTRGDTILICSDGVTESPALTRRPDSLMTMFAQSVGYEPQVLAERVADLAKSEGQTDDITVISVRRR
ncbi:MAG: PP2C family protein-serine/threonine phosphatase [Coriobacteriia bacterium]